MTWIKICGMTNLEDAQAAADAGADAVGFVFYEKSPRNIDPEAAKNIIAKLPTKLEKVGVFVHGSNGQMEKIAQQAGLTGVQVHADPSLNGQPPEPGFLLNSNATQRFRLNCFLGKRDRVCNGFFRVDGVLTPSFSIPVPSACRAVPEKYLTGKGRHPRLA